MPRSARSQNVNSTGMRGKLKQPNTFICGDFATQSRPGRQTGEFRGTMKTPVGSTFWRVRLKDRQAHVFSPCRAQVDADLLDYRSDCLARSPSLRTALDDSDTKDNAANYQCAVCSGLRFGGLVGPSFNGKPIPLAQNSGRRDGDRSMSGVHCS